MQQELDPKRLQPEMKKAGGTGLDAPVDILKGIGDQRRALLEKLGIHTVRDLLLHIPMRYEDRSHREVIASLQDGQTGTFVATAAAPPAHSRPRRTLSVWRLTVTDGTGYLNVSWFNQDYAVKNIRQGDRFLFHGTIKCLGNQISMTNPAFETIHDESDVVGGILPVYPLTKGLSQNRLRGHMRQALSCMTPLSPVDPLPEPMRKRLKLMGWLEAVHGIHFPESLEDANLARRRLAFEELLVLQLGMHVQRGINARRDGIPMPRQELADVRTALPFSLTEAQERVLQEVLRDMEQPVAMNRMIQGDVGSGKTVVAFLSALSAIRSGCQTALMVPTEILADQHALAAEELLVPFGVRVWKLKGGMRKRERDKMKDALRSGGPDLVIGTHALLTEDIVFDKLGLVITDEQHRFGVRQRALLRGKGHVPHLLVMTATPIPRTLSLTLYGDLDLSLLDGMPPGRKPIRTYVVEEGMRPRIEAFIRKTVQEGHQVYVVCPMIEEAEEQEGEAAQVVAARLQAHVFPDLQIGLLHGRMKAQEKADVMSRFVSGRMPILVATTVIEVGVNVPNASVMLIENAERFGLSQLHQLRGRVGRGAAQSSCILFRGGGGKIAAERLKAVADTQDGFVLAERDLALRGPGEVFGTRQSGLPECRIADLHADLDLVQATRDEAVLIAEQSATPEIQLLRRDLLRRFSDRIRDIAMN